MDTAVDTATLKSRAGLPASGATPSSDERLLRPRVIGTIVVFLLAMAAALATPERELDPGTAAYEAGRFSNAR